MTEREMTFVKELPLDDLYINVKWPAIELLMEYNWFDSECWLRFGTGNQENPETTCFVPISRFLEAQADITHLKPEQSLLP